MPGRGLLSRLSAQDPASQRRSDQDIDSIVEHLRGILNTRQGDAVTVPDYGIMDFTDVMHNFPEAIQTLQRAIRATIIQYEPRLKNVVVQHLADEEVLIVKFRITAQLAGKGGRGGVRFETQLLAGGEVTVR